MYTENSLKGLQTVKHGVFMLYLKKKVHFILIF